MAEQGGQPVAGAPGGLTAAPAPPGEAPAGPEGGTSNNTPAAKKKWVWNPSRELQFAQSCYKYLADIDEKMSQAQRWSNICSDMIALHPGFSLSESTAREKLKALRVDIQAADKNGNNSGDVVDESPACAEIRKMDKELARQQALTPQEKSTETQKKKLAEQARRLVLEAVGTPSPATGANRVTLEVPSSDVSDNQSDSPSSTATSGKKRKSREGLGADFELETMSRNREETKRFKADKEFSLEVMRIESNERLKREELQQRAREQEQHSQTMQMMMQMMQMIRGGPPLSHGPSNSAHGPPAGPPAWGPGSTWTQN